MTNRERAENIAGRLRATHDNDVEIAEWADPTDVAGAIEAALNDAEERGADNEKELSDPRYDINSPYR